MNRIWVIKLAVKPKILFISHDFAPDFNGTISCIENILPHLAKSYDITLYTPLLWPGTKETERLKSVTVKRMHSFWDKVFFDIDRLHQFVYTKNLPGALKNALGFTFKSLRFIARRISDKYGFGSKSRWRRYTKKNDLSGYHAVIAVCAPFSNVRAACEIKKQYHHMKMILLEFDLYTYNPLLLRFDKSRSDTFSKRLKEENNWFGLADKVFVMKEMYEVLMTSELAKWPHKMSQIEIPNLTGTDVSSLQQVFSEDNQTINVVYAGMFYKDIRNPKFLINLFSEVCSRNKQVRLHILGFGCEDQLAAAKTKMGDNLVLHGKKDRIYTQNAIYSADILINVSNNIPTQVPSKIFEYIGHGKPIVNLYSIDGDACEKILSDYPLCLSVRENEIMINQVAETVTDFILENKDTYIDFENIKEKYSRYMPETFANEMMKVLSDK